MIESEVLQILIQGGAVGISFVCLGIIYKMQNGQRQSFIETLERNSDAWNKNAKALAKLSERLE